MHIYCELLGRATSTPKSPGKKGQQIWWEGRAGLTGQRKQTWDVTWAAGSWAIWKERNRRTFNQKSKPENILINDAAMDVHNWVLFS